MNYLPMCRQILCSIDRPVKLNVCLSMSLVRSRKPKSDSWCFVDFDNTPKSDCLLFFMGIFVQEKYFLSWMEPPLHAKAGGEAFDSEMHPGQQEEMKGTSKQAVLMGLQDGELGKAEWKSYFPFFFLHPTILDFSAFTI